MADFQIEVTTGNPHNTKFVKMKFSFSCSNSKESPQ